MVNEFYDKNTSDEVIERFGKGLIKIASTGNQMALNFVMVWAKADRELKLDLMNRIHGIVQNVIASARTLHQGISEIFVSMGADVLQSYGEGLAKQDKSMLRALEALSLDLRCGHACDFAHPYGFVPEAGCPVHDIDKED